MDNNQNNLAGSVNLNLGTLNNVEVVEYKGKQCVIIPVDENGIFLSEKGGKYLPFIMSPLSEMKWGKTHTFKRKLTRDEYQRFTKAQKDAMPVVGYLEPFKPREATPANNFTQPGTPQNQATPIQSSTPSYQSTDGLPF